MCWGCNCSVVASTVVAQCEFKGHCYCQGHIAEDGLCLDYEVKDPEGVECGEMNKMAQSGPLTPCSHDLSPHVSPQTMTLHGYVTTEIIYSTAHAHHKILN